jgi:hypothetical protein
MVSRNRLALAVDLVASTILLLLASVPLFSPTVAGPIDPAPESVPLTEHFGMGGEPSREWLRLAAATAVLGVLTCVAWLALRRFRFGPAGATEPGSPEPPPPGPGPLPLLLIAAAALIAFVGFFQPLRREFWSGTDDVYYLNPKILVPWNLRWEKSLGRPTCFWAGALARTLLPGRVEGFLYLAYVLCLTNSLLLAAVLRRLAPGQRFLWCAAPLLYIVQTADPHRFYVLWATCFYWSGLLPGLLAVWLFVRSYDLNARGQLVASCLCLGLSLLTTEAGFPLAAFVPGLLLLRGRQPSRLPVWCWCWLGTVGILGAHFALHLAEARYQSYQWFATRDALTRPGVLLENFLTMLGSIQFYFRLPRWDGSHAGTASAVLIACLSLLGMAWSRGSSASRRVFLGTAGVACLAIVLAVLPFVSLGGYFRTLLYAAPAQAVLVTCVIGGLAAFFPRAGRAAVAAVGATALVMAGVQENVRLQNAVPSNRFVDVVRVFEQIHAVSPGFRSDALILLIPDGDIANVWEPFPAIPETGDLIARSTVGNHLFVCPRDDPDRYVHFRGHDVEVKLKWGGEHSFWGYDKLVAFRLARDGTVSLLRRLPAGLLPAVSDGDRYDPLACMKPGPGGPLPYLRYPGWADRPRDVFDAEDGVMLGQGWDAAAYKCVGRCKWELSRWVGENAELAVNPQGGQRRQLHLDLEGGPWFDGRPWHLQVLAENGDVVSSATIIGRQEVAFDLPTNVDRVGVFRLCVAGADAESVKDIPRDRIFRVFRTLDPDLSYRIPCVRESDVMHDGLRAGEKLHPITNVNGIRCRSAEDGACIHLAVCPDAATVLHIDLEPESGLPERPCHVTAVTDSGEYLASAWLFGRQDFCVPLPRKRCQESAIRLRADDGATAPTAAGDARAGFVRVYGCRCSR